MQPLESAALSRGSLLIADAPLEVKCCNSSLVMQTLTEISILLAGMRAGHPKAASRFMEKVSSELRQAARTRVRLDRSGEEFNPWDLVNEVYVRLVGRDSALWENRAYYFGVAPPVMRRILVERAKRARKKGLAFAGPPPDCLPEVITLGLDPAEVIRLDSALNHLASVDRRQARIVEMRFFAGLPFDEIADVLQISLRTARRDWLAAVSRLEARTRIAAAS